VNEKNIQIKGISDGLLVTLRENPWNEAKKLVISRIDEKETFFQGAKIALDVGSLSLKAADLGKFRDELSGRGITLWAVMSNSDVTLNTAQILGLSTQLSVRQNHEKEKTSSTFFEGDSAVWVEKTLRAGYKVETKSHVVVMGDVNPGAEIISAGSILVWGRLCGSIHAGADGNRQAQVLALEFEAMNLRIAEFIASPLLKKKKGQPEFAHIQDNAIVIDNWIHRKIH
jgi:septum site-determining protein MinC